MKFVLSQSNTEKDNTETIQEILEYVHMMMMMMMMIHIITLLKNVGSGMKKPHNILVLTSSKYAKNTQRCMEQNGHRQTNNQLGTEQETGFNNNLLRDTGFQQIKLFSTKYCYLLVIFCCKKLKRKTNCSLVPFTLLKEC